MTNFIKYANYKRNLRNAKKLEAMNQKKNNNNDENNQHLDPDNFVDLIPSDVSGEDDGEDDQGDGYAKFSW